MGWEHKAEPVTHVCAPPCQDQGLSPGILPVFQRPEGGTLGDRWRCEDCGQLWRIGLACDYCDRYGRSPHQGQHAVGMTWRKAHESWWSRRRHRRAINST